jgi:hypothetical protein
MHNSLLLPRSLLYTELLYSDTGVLYTQVLFRSVRTVNGLSVLLRFTTQSVHVTTNYAYRFRLLFVKVQPIAHISNDEFHSSLYTRVVRLHFLEVLLSYRLLSKFTADINVTVVSNSISKFIIVFTLFICDGYVSCR